MDKKFLYEQKAQIFKALANPVRLEIIDFLADGEKCVCEIADALHYEQPHISKSLLKLKEVGLIGQRKEGLNVYYSLQFGCMREFLHCLDTALSEKSLQETKAPRAVNFLCKRKTKNFFENK